MTLIATGLSVFGLRPEVDEAAIQAIADQQVTGGSDLIIAPSVSLSMYPFMTVISVIKPWGLTKRGQRQRSRARTPVDAKEAHAPA